MPYQKLTAVEGGEKSAVIRDRIEAARERQLTRFEKLGKSGLLANGDERRASRLGGGAGVLPAGRRPSTFGWKYPGTRDGESVGHQCASVSSGAEAVPNQFAFHR